MHRRRRRLTGWLLLFMILLSSSRSSLLSFVFHSPFALLASTNHARLLLWSCRAFDWLVVVVNPAFIFSLFSVVLCRAIAVRLACVDESRAFLVASSSFDWLIVVHDLLCCRLSCTRRSPCWRRRITRVSGCVVVVLTGWLLLFVLLSSSRSSLLSFVFHSPFALLTSTNHARFLLWSCRLTGWLLLLILLSSSRNATKTKRRRKQRDEGKGKQRGVSNVKNRK